MIDELSKTLKAILDDAQLPSFVKDADVTFERPGDAYAPSVRTINLFLFDIRENSELRSNESRVSFENGNAKITPPPLRFSCSYLVSVWIESTLSGEQAVLEQQRLLGAVLRIFASMPVIDGKYLTGELKDSLYPVSLLTGQADMVRSPSEFWTAIGGKLRPSFIVTANISMDQNIEPVEEYLVSSRQVTLGEKLPDETALADNELSETFSEAGGVVTDKKTGKAIESVELTLAPSGKLATTDRFGRYWFTGLQKGSYAVRVVKEGYKEISAFALTVPGSSPTAFDIKL